MWEWINERTREWEQKHIIEPGNNVLKEELGVPLKDSLIQLGKDTWVWFVEVLPDIAGYGVMASGAFIMLAPLIGGKGMMKPLGFLAGGLILSVCILMTN